MSFVSLVFQGGAGGSAGGSGGEATSAAAPQTVIGAVTLDALLDEATTLSAKASEYAVEDGAPISDNITEEAEQLALTGWITAAQINAYGSGGRSKMIAAKDALRTIHKERQTITVVTGMDTYPDMVMENCKMSRDPKGDFFEITADFKRLRKVTLRTVDVPPEKVKASDKAKGKAGSTKTNAGKPATKDDKVPDSDLGKATGWMK